MLITADYEEIQNASASLQQQSADCESRIRQMLSVMEQTAEIWQGEDCQMFISQAQGLQPHLMRLTELMYQYAQVLSRTSQTYRQLQQDRLQQAARLL